jgi:hypothetical protein
MSRDVAQRGQVVVGRSSKKSVSLVEVEVVVEAGTIAVQHSGIQRPLVYAYSKAAAL